MCYSTTTTKYNVLLNNNLRKLGTDAIHSKIPLISSNSQTPLATEQISMSCQSCLSNLFPFVVYVLYVSIAGQNYRHLQVHFLART